MGSLLDLLSPASGTLLDIDGVALRPGQRHQQSFYSLTTDALIWVEKLPH